MLIPFAGGRLVRPALLALAAVACTGIGSDKATPDKNEGPVSDHGDADTDADSDTDPRTSTTGDGCEVFGTCDSGSTNDGSGGG